MIRWHLQTAVWVSVLLMLVLLLIQTQPYDDHALRQIALPDGCPAPCFMGIRPGITTVNEALQILRSSGWTADIRMEPATSRWIVVEWNEKAPKWLNSQSLYIDTMLAMRDSRIDEVHVATTLSLADAELLLGRPSAIDIRIFKGMNGDSHDFPALIFASAYFSRSMVIGISKNCGEPVTHQTLYVDLRYYSDIEKQNDLLRQFQNSWADVLRTTC